MIFSGLLNLLHLLLYYLITHLLFKILRVDDQSESPFYSAFMKSVLGFLFVVSLYAIVQTDGNTILALVPISIIILIIFIKKQFKSINRIVRNQDYAPFHVILYLATVNILLTAFLWLHFYPQPGIEQHLKGDFMIYSKISDFINYYGIENRCVDYFFPFYHRPEPYHYGEHWLSAIAINMYGCKAEIALVVFAYGQILSLTVLGVAALLEKKFKLSIYWIVIISFTSLFIGPLGQLFPLQLGYFSEFWGDVTYLALPKLSIVLLFLLFIELQLFHKSYVAFSIGCGLLSLFYAPCLSILPISFLILCKDYLAKNIIIKTLYIAVAILGISVVILIFKYGYLPETEKTTWVDLDLMKFETNQKQFDWLLYSRTLINIGGVAILYFVKTIFIYGIIIIALLIYLYKWQKIKLLVVINSTSYTYSNILVFLLLPILAWGCLPFISTDSFQFWLMMFYPFLVILIVKLLATLLMFVELRFLVLIIIVLNLFTHPLTINHLFKAKTLAEELKLQQISANAQDKVAYFCKPSSNNSIYLFSNDEVVQDALGISPYFSRTADLSIFDLDTSFIGLKYNASSQYFFFEMIKQAPFYIYLRKCRYENPLISIESAQIKFLRDFSVHWVYVEEGVTLCKELNAVLLPQIVLDSSIVYKVLEQTPQENLELLKQNH